MPVVVVDIEVSLQAYEQQTKDGKPQCSFFPFRFWEAHAYR